MSACTDRHTRIRAPRHPIHRPPHRGGRPDGRAHAPAGSRSLRPSGGALGVSAARFHCAFERWGGSAARMRVCGRGKRGDGHTRGKACISPPPVSVGSPGTEGLCSERVVQRGNWVAAGVGGRVGLVLRERPKATPCVTRRSVTAAPFPLCRMWQAWKRLCLRRGVGAPAAPSATGAAGCRWHPSEPPQRPRTWLLICT